MQAPQAHPVRTLPMPFAQDPPEPRIAVSAGTVFEYCTAICTANTLTVSRVLMRMVARHAPPLPAERARWTSHVCADDPPSACASCAGLTLATTYTASPLRSPRTRPRAMTSTLPLSRCTNEMLLTLTDRSTGRELFDLGSGPDVIDVEVVPVVPPTVPMSAAATDPATPTTATATPTAIGWLHLEAFASTGRGSRVSPSARARDHTT